MTKTTEQYTPQQNFYQSQNSDWLNDPKNAIPDEYSSWGSFMRLRDNSLKQQIAILSELADKYNKDTSQLNEDEKKLASIYQKTMQKYKDWDNKLGDYNELIKELNYLKQNVHSDNFLTLAKYGEYCMKNGINYLFEIDKGSDMQHVDNVLLDISPCHLSLPTREYYLDEKFQKQRDYYLAHLDNVNKIMKKNGVDLTDKFVSNVFEFEEKLAYIMMTRSQARLYDQYYTKTNLTGVYNSIETHNFVKQKLDNYKEEDKQVSLSEEEKDEIKSFMENIYENLELRKYMIQNYKKNLAQDQSGEHENALELTLYDGDYFVRMFKLLSDKNNRYQCYSWLEYNIIKSMSEYCTKELNDEFFDFYNRKLNDQQEQKTHEKRAVILVNAWVGELLGKIYVGKYFSKESKNNIISMIDNVLAMMRNSLTNNTWLTESTKKNALLKLEYFVNKIGYPDIWKDYTLLDFNENNTLFEIRNMVKRFIYQTEFLNKINTKLDKKKWLMSPQTVNAYYHPQLNEVVFPAAILQPPFYQSTFDSIDMNIENEEYYKKLGFDPLVPINHGSIIAVIAHEITHGYDDQGRKFDHQGNMVDWWTEEDIKLFTERTKLMGKQAEMYQYIDSENKTHTMKADLTMGENLADLGGLTLSLKALLTDEAYNNPEAIKLFFMSWANVWKENRKEQLSIQQLAADPHAPVDFRCNLVKNIDMFYQIFDVNENDEMWLKPEDRVKMW
jgi:putative endopeptidase